MSLMDDISNIKRTRQMLKQVEQFNDAYSKQLDEEYSRIARMYASDTSVNDEQEASQQVLGNALQFGVQRVNQPVNQADEKQAGLWDNIKLGWQGLKTNTDNINDEWGVSSLDKDYRRLNKDEFIDKKTNDELNVADPFVKEAYEMTARQKEIERIKRNNPELVRIGEEAMQQVQSEENVKKIRQKYAQQFDELDNEFNTRLADYNAANKDLEDAQKQAGQQGLVAQTTTDIINSGPNMLVRGGAGAVGTVVGAGIGSLAGPEGTVAGARTGGFIGNAGAGYKLAYGDAFMQAINNGSNKKVADAYATFAGLIEGGVGYAPFLKFGKGGFISSGLAEGAEEASTTVLETINEYFHDQDPTFKNAYNSGNTGVWVPMLAERLKRSFLAGTGMGVASHGVAKAYNKVTGKNQQPQTAPNTAQGLSEQLETGQLKQNNAQEQSAPQPNAHILEEVLAPLQDDAETYQDYHNDLLDDIASGEIYERAKTNSDYGQYARAYLARAEQQAQQSNAQIDTDGFPVNNNTQQAELISEEGEVVSDESVSQNNTFGNVYTQFKGKVKDAISFLLAKQEGVAVGALNHQQVGDIDLVYGTDTYGLKKIAQKHPEMLQDMQEKISEMEIKQASDNRIVLENDTHKAIISNNWFGKKRDNWLLTAYEKKDTVSASSIDNGTELKMSSGIDTATPTNGVDSSIANNQQNTIALQGKQDMVVVDEKRHGVTYKVVEASELSPSKKDTDNQYRNREDNKNAQAQVTKISKNPEFYRLKNAPTIDVGSPTLAKDGKTVIGGNGRIMGVQQAYKQGTADNYKNDLIESAEELGFNPDDIASMKEPVLVRTFNDDVDVKRLAIASNETQGMAMSALENARADAENLPDLDSLHLDDNMFKSDTGGLDTASNRNFVRGFVSGFSENQRNDLTDSSGVSLSNRGVERLRNAILYRAFGNSKILESAIEHNNGASRNLLNALVRIAPKVAKVKSRIENGALPNVDISKHIVSAVDTLVTLAREGVSVRDYLKQGNLAFNELHPVTKKMIIYIHKNGRSGKRIFDLFDAYYDKALSLPNPQNGNLFGEAPVNSDELFYQSLNEQEHRNEQAKQHNTKHKEQQKQQSTSEIYQDSGQQSTNTGSDGSSVEGSGQTTKTKQENQVSKDISNARIKDNSDAKNSHYWRTAFNNDNTITGKLSILEAISRENQTAEVYQDIIEVGQQFSPFAMLRVWANIEYRTRNSNNPAIQKIHSQVKELREKTLNNQASQDGAFSLSAKQKEQRGIYNVTFNDKNSTIIRKDLETVEDAIKYEKGLENPNTKTGFGSLHIEKHLDPNQDGYVTTEELLNMGDIIRSTEPKISRGNRLYEKHINGVRFRAVIGKKKNGERVITFYSNRKAQKNDGGAGRNSLHDYFNPSSNRVGKENDTLTYNYSNPVTNDNTTKLPNNQEKSDSKIRSDLEKTFGKKIASKVEIVRHNETGDKQSSTKAGAEGYYEGGDKVFINPDNIHEVRNDKGEVILTKQEHIAFVAWHELGHRGVAVSNLWKEYRSSLIKASKHPVIRALAKSFQKGYAEQGHKISNETAVEEALVELNAALKTGNVKALLARRGVDVKAINKAELNTIYKRVADIIKRVIHKIRGKKMPIANQDVMKVLEVINENMLADIEGKGTGDIKNSLAWHGSPHSFDKFSTEFMGTGEGAQAYGWGLYFTDKKSIAKEYANMGNGVKVNGKLLYKNNTSYLKDFDTSKEEDYFALNALIAEAGDKENAINHLRSFGNDAMTEKSINAINSYNIETNKGNRNLYKVKIHGDKTIDELNFMRWDKPLKKKYVEDIKNIFDEIVNAESDYHKQSELSREFEKIDFNKLDGEQIYEKIAEHLGQKEASLKLLENGIDGIQYPTEYLSKGQHDNNYNYVVFDENTVAIEEHTKFSLNTSQNSDFARAVDAVARGRVIKRQYLNLGTTPTALKIIGLPDTKVSMHTDVIKKVMGGKHNLNAQDLKQIPQQINDPVAVFNSSKTSSNPDGYVVLTELTEKIDNENKPVIVALNVKKTQNGLEVINIASTYGRKNIKPILKNKPLYWNTIKGRKFVDSFGLQLPAEAYSHNALSSKNIKTEKDLSQVEITSNQDVKYSLSTPQTELETVRKQYQNTDKWLKAPNGKPTKLTEKQWLQTRTPSFKKWFGDWENDPANASKVVDENGEPLVVYHGTNAEFNTFDIKLDWSGEKGAFFSDSENVAKQYGNKAIPVFLNIPDVTEINAENKSFNDARDTISDFEYELKNIGRWSDGLKISNVFDHPTGLKKGKKSTVFAVSEPNQIKSATDNIGSFDVSNDDIRYSLNTRDTNSEQKAQRIEKLKNAKDAVISGNEIDVSGDVKQNKRNAFEYGKRLANKSYLNDDVGKKYNLYVTGIKEALQHDYKNKEHLQSIAAIPQMIENAIYIDTLPNTDSKRPDIKEFDYFVVGLKIGNVPYTARLVMAQSHYGEAYYDHKLSNIEKGDLTRIIHTDNNSGGSSNSPLSEVNDKRLLQILQGDNTKYSLAGQPKQAVLELAESGKATEPANPLNGVKSGDFSGFKKVVKDIAGWADEKFADNLRPVNDWIDEVLIPHLGEAGAMQGQQLRDAMYLAKGAKEALMVDIEKKYLQPLGKDLAGLSKKYKLDLKTTKRLVGYWASTRYSIDKNRELLAREKQAFLDAEKELEAVQVDYDIAKQEGNITDEIQKKLNETERTYRKAKKQYEGRNHDVNRTDKSKPFKVGTAGGWSIADAQEIMQKIEGHISRADLEKVCEHIYGANQLRLKKDRDAGRYTDEQYNDYKKNRHYVPLTGDPDAIDTDDVIAGVGNDSVNGGKDKQLKGRTSSEAEDGIDASWRAISGTATYVGWSDFKNKIDDFYETRLAELKAQGKTELQAKKEIEETLGITKSRMKGTTRSNDNVLIRKVGGVYYEYRLPKKAINALLSNNVEKPNWVFDKIGGATRAYARGVTGWKLGFALINMARDVWEKSEFIRVQKIYDKDGNLLDDKTMDKIGNALWIGAITPSKEKLATIKNFVLDKELGDSQTAQDLQTLLKYGGVSTYRTYLAKTEKDLLKKVKSENVGLAKKLHQAGTLVDAYNKAFDITSSLASYQALRKHGVDEKQAAAITLELTNFNKTGSAMKPIKMLYAFAQPTAMGGRNLTKYLSTKKGRKRFMVYMVAMSALYSLLRAMADDDEGGNLLDQLGDITRYIPIPLPNGEFFKFPVGFGMPQLAWNWAVNTQRALYGDISTTDAAVNMFMQSVKSYAPISPSEISASKHPIDKAMLTFTPTVLQPWVQNQINRNAFGSQVHSGFPNNKKLKAEQGRATTAEEWKDLALLINDVTDKDWYPEDIKNVVTNYANFFGSASNLITVAIENPNRERLGRPTKNVLLGRFITPPNQYAISNRYYEASDEAQTFANNVNSQANRGKQINLSQKDRKILNWNRVSTKRMQNLRKEKSKATKMLNSGRISKKQYSNFLSYYGKKTIKEQRMALNAWRKIQGLNTTETDK